VSRCFACLWIVAIGTAFAADGPESANVRNESTTTRKRLAEAEQKILAGQSADALDELLRILDEVGDDLVTADGKVYSSARHYAHRFLAKLPDDRLARYRDRVEEPASKLLARGQSELDPALLRQLLDRYAVSRPAEDAHLLLAELAFERGAFGTAERHWRALLPEAEPRYPAPRSKPAELQAKILLATIRRGDRDSAARLLDEFAKSYPDATGRLAGRTGKLAEILLEQANARPAPLPAGADGGWTTLGGSPARDGSVPGRLPRHWPARPTWTSTIPSGLDGWRGKTGRPASVGAVKALAFHPVVLGSAAYLADAGRVFAFDLRTGTRRLVFDSSRIEHPRVLPATLGVPSPVDADFALTAADGKLYLRIGAPELFPVPEEGEPSDPKPSVLVALAPSAGNAPAEVVWRRFPPVADGVPASWEGAPIVVEGDVIVAYARSEGGRTIHALACYRGESERPVWTTDVCETSAAAPRTRHEFVALAGRNVVFCSQSGVVAAVNAKTGKPAWAYRYPRVRRYAADPRHRDASPPVAADGRVFVAPNDADQLFAFDAETGAPLWSDGPLLVDHLLGAANGKVVAAIAGPQRGLRAYDAATGSCDFPRGWRNHDDPFLPTFGRGLLNDEFILWPTASALYTIRLVDGTVASQPLRGSHGNLAYASGTLLVTTPTELRGTILDPGEPDPPTPKPILLGKAEPLPNDVHPPKPALELLPALESPLKTSTLSPPARGAAWNLGEPSWSDGVIRLVRRTSAEAELVDSNGRSMPVPVSDPRQTLWLGDRVLVASDRTLAFADAAVGRTKWSLDLPTIDDLDAIPGGILVRCGGHHLVAVHATSGSVAWALDARNQRRFEPNVVESAARFHTLAVFGNRIHAGRTDGTRWLLNARDGTRLSVAPSTDRPSPDPSVVFESDSLLFADGPNRIARIAANGKLLWSIELGAEASLTGEIASVRLLDDILVAIVRRNHGVELDVLAARDGARRWREPALLGAAAFDARSLSADRQYVFAATADRLHALRRDTGRTAWSVPLPVPTVWRLVALRNTLLAVPLEAIPVDPPNPLRSFAAFPHPRRALGLLGTALDAATVGTVPLRVFDPATGELRGRLDLPAAGPVAVRLDTERVWITAGGTIHSLQ
jgi:outer membrane protein assembly factor BamB